MACIPEYGRQKQKSRVNYWFYTAFCTSLNLTEPLGGGDEGIRTLDTSFGPYAPLAGECLRPLGHISGLLSIFNCSGMHDNSFSSAPGQWTSLCFLHFSHGCQNRISGVFSFFLFSGAFMLFRPVPVARSFLHDGV